MLRDMPGNFKVALENDNRLLNCFLKHADVHIMFATFASPEEFRPFVQDFDRDIIRMQGYTIYADAAPAIASRLATGIQPLDTVIRRKNH